MSKRICAVCGVEYSYCPNCFKDFDKPKFMMSVHNKNCYDIWNILCEYGSGASSKEDVAEKLKKCDLSKVSEFKEPIRQQIKEVLGAQKKNSFFSDGSNDSDAQSKTFGRNRK